LITMARRARSFRRGISQVIESHPDFRANILTQ
jgi:hypothetical protein